MILCGEGRQVPFQASGREKAAVDYYVGIDVSLEKSSVCVVDATGRIVREIKVVSESEALVALLAGLELAVARVGLEAGPLSQWLHDGLAAAGHEVLLLETRHVKAHRLAGPAASARLRLNDGASFAHHLVAGLGMPWPSPITVLQCKHKAR